MVSLFAKTHVSHVAAAGVACLLDLLVVFDLLIADQLVSGRLIVDLLVVLLDSMISEQSRVVKMVASALAQAVSVLMVVELVV